MSETSDEINEIVLKSVIEIVRDLGFMAYKFLITLNSGAFIVLLTFVGNTEGSTKFYMELGYLKCAMWSFLVAILATFVAMTVSYVIGQMAFVDRRLPFGKSALGIVLWQLFPVIIALGLFFAGAAFAINGIVTK